MLNRSPGELLEAYSARNSSHSSSAHTRWEREESDPLEFTLLMSRMPWRVCAAEHRRLRCAVFVGMCWEWRNGARESTSVPCSRDDDDLLQ